MATFLLDQRLAFSPDGGVTIAYDALDGLPGYEATDPIDGAFVALARGVGEWNRAIGVPVSLTRPLEDSSPMGLMQSYDSDGFGVPVLSGVTPVAVGFYRDLEGTVWLKGLLKGGSLGQPAFTLPVGCRPLEDLLFRVHSETSAIGVFGSVRVRATGDVVPELGGNALVSLSGISFRGEQ